MIDLYIALRLAGISDEDCVYLANKALPDGHEILTGRQIKEKYDLREVRVARIRPWFLCEESSIPIIPKYSYCDKQKGYGQIVWENEDIHQYFLVDDTQKAEQVLKEYYKYQEGEGEEAGRIPQNTGNAGKVPQDGLNATPSDSLILNLSTVHVHPDAVEFLSVPMNADALQVFPNSDQCVLHIADAKAAGDYDIPPSVKDCIRHAGKRGCSWIHFSYEGEENKHLPTYRTAWDRIM